MQFVGQFSFESLNLLLPVVEHSIFGGVYFAAVLHEIAEPSLRVDGSEQNAGIFLFDFEASGFDLIDEILLQDIDICALVGDGFVLILHAFEGEAEVLNQRTEVGMVSVYA